MKASQGKLDKVRTGWPYSGGRGFCKAINQHQYNYMHTQTVDQHATNV